MTRWMQRTLRRWAVLMLAVGGAAAMAMPHGGPGGPGGPGAGFMGRGMDRMLERVNATPEQKAQIDQIMRKAREDMRAQHQATAGLRQQMAELFAQATVDANAVEALRLQMLAGHDQASRRMTQAMVEVSRVLSPEQRQQMLQQMRQRQEMMQRHHRERQQLDRQGS